MRIFLVDDDAIIRKGMRKIIEKSEGNYTIVGEATDGELALEKLKTCGPIDLIITDIRMPIMDGLELIKHIRLDDQLVKIIVVSGFDDYSYVRNAFIDGAVDYLLKPINKNRLLELLIKVASEIESEQKSRTTQEENQSILIKRAFKSLVSKTGDQSKAFERLKRYGIVIDQAYFVAVTRLSKKDKKEKYQLRDQFMQISNEQQELYLAKGIRFEQLVDDEEIITTIYSDYEQFKRINEEHLSEHKNLIVGYSTIYSNFLSLGYAYDEAEVALQRVFFDDAQYFEFHSIKNIQYDEEVQLDGIISRLKNNMELYNYFDVSRDVDTLFLEIAKLHPDSIRKQMLKVLDRLIYHIEGLKPMILEYDSDYLATVETTETLIELKKYMNGLMKHLTVQMRLESDKRSKKRIELAKDYIKNHYMESISLNGIAEVVELNGSYFSNLFKIETNMNFSEYLLNVRINAAKKLLKDPTLKVYEVGQRVGYEDAVSFGRAFKNKVGMSPKQYRNTVY